MGSRGLTRRLPVLAIRDFRILLADRVLAPLATAFSMVGVSFAVLDATGSAASLSYVLAAQIAPSLVFSLIGGVFADRFRPQRVIIVGNLMIAAGEAAFGVLVLTGRPGLPVMIALEILNGSGIALFYPAATSLLPRLVPARQLRQASSLSRLAMNAGTMAGSALAGECVALLGPGWALTICGIAMLGTVPLMLAIRVTPLAQPGTPGILRELREGWSEFRAHTWLWATVLQFSVVMAAWYGGVQVLGPVVARAHFGGAAAWGLLASCEAIGMLAGALLALGWAPRRPVLAVALIGASVSIAPLCLARPVPLPVLCAVAFGLGVVLEVLAITWTVTMAAKIPADKLARVSAYDALGSIMGMPVGALVAGPVAALAGVPVTECGVTALILVASGLVLCSSDVRRLRLDSGPPLAALDANAVQSAV